MESRKELVTLFSHTEAEIEKAALKAVKNRPAYRRYVLEYFAWIRETGESIAEPETLKKYLRTLRGRYHGGSYAPLLAGLKAGIRGAAAALLSAREAAIVSEALRSVKAPRKTTNAVQREKILSQSEEHAAMELMTPRDAVLFHFLIRTGCRISEALAIQRHEARVQEGHVEIPIHGKGDKLRTVRISSEHYREIVDTYDGETWLFETAKGKPLHRSYAYRRISEAVTRATGKRFSPHCARHCFATRMLERTGKLKAVSEYLGHSSTRITADIYLHENLSDEELFSE